MRRKIINKKLFSYLLCILTNEHSNISHHTFEHKNVKNVYQKTDSNKKLARQWQGLCWLWDKTDSRECSATVIVS